MNPAQQQQESEARPERLGDTSMEDVLSEEFDRMAAEDAGESEEVTEESGEEVEAQSEATEEAAPEETASQEEQEGEGEQELSVEEELAYDEPAPERWPAEMKEAYASLTPQMKQALMENVFKPMQRQYTQGTQELAETKKSIEPMLQTLHQYQNDFERMGMNPTQAFQQQVAWAAHFARVGPQQGIADMQAAYGLNKAEQGQQEEQYLTPVERDMKAQLTALQEQVQQTSQGQKQYLEQQQQSHQQAWENEVRTGLHTFINETKDGKPSHPHVEKVAPAIAGLIRGGLVRKVDDMGNRVSIRDQMQQAYDMAVNLDPSIRTAISGKKQVRNAQAAQEVDVVATTPGAEAPVTSDRPIAEDINDLFDKLNRRVG